METGCQPIKCSVPFEMCVLVLCKCISRKLKAHDSTTARKPFCWQNQTEALQCEGHITRNEALQNFVS